MKQRREPTLWILTGLVLATAALAGQYISAGIHAGVSTYKSSNLLSTFSVELRGEVELTADDRDIASVSQGGRLEIFERDGLKTRRLTIENGAGGLEYTYLRGGDPQPFDGDARAWFEEILSRIVREIGIGAEGRVRRILADSGPDGVLEAIGDLDGSTATRIYSTELLEQGDLEADQLTRLAEAATDGISSSGDLSRFLRDASGRYLAGGAVDGFFEATQSIASSGDHARVLLHVINRDLTDDATKLARLLRSARDISSSGDKARVLAATADVWIEDEAVRRAFFDTAGSIASSGDHSRALIALLDRSSPAAPTVAGAFRSTHGISSSSDKARVLIQGANRFHGSGAVRREYLDAAADISSSSDKARTLLRLIDTGALDEEGMIDLLRTARGISASSEKTRVLVAAARQVDGDDAVEAYLSTAETIASSSDQRRALSALVR